MKIRTTLIITSLALAGTGCGWNWCFGGAIGTYCNEEDGGAAVDDFCDDGGGDDVGGSGECKASGLVACEPSAPLTPISSSYGDLVQPSPQWCWTDENPRHLQLHEQEDIEDCALLHEPVECGGTWSHTGHSECFLCEPRQWQLANGQFDLNQVNRIGDVASWGTWMQDPGPSYVEPLTWFVNPEDSWAPVTVQTIWNGIPSLGDLNWEDYFDEKTDYGLGIFLGSCPEGFYGLRSDGNSSTINAHYTCICDEGWDASCQPGTICESGVVIKDGHEHATLCTWDQPGSSGLMVDGQRAVLGPDSDINGIAPDGPEVYGHSDFTWVHVDAAARIIRVDADAIDESTVPGLLNDNQRFDLDEATSSAMITHCGPRSLCRHLSLEAGDVLSLDATGSILETELQIVRETVAGSVEHWTIIVE